MSNSICKFLTLSVLATGFSVAAAGAQSITTTIPIAHGARGLAVNPVTNRVYVVAAAIPTATSTNLAVIDGRANTVLTNISIPAGSKFVAVDDIRNRVFVAGCNTHVTPTSCTVTAIDGEANTVISSLQVTTTSGLGLEGIVASPLYGRVYVANASDSVIDIVSANENKLLGTIGLAGNSPTALAINPLLDWLYVPYGTNQTAIVDAPFKKVINTITFGADTVGAAVNYVNGEVLITDLESGPSMTGVFTATGNTVASVVVGDGPLGVDVDPFTKLAFVASTQENSISVINSSTNTVTATVPGIIGASYVAVNVATKTVYVTGTRGVTVVTE